MNVKRMKVVLVSANYPDKYHLWAPWNKSANLVISKLDDVEIEVVAPRPFSIPLKYFPYKEISQLPIKEQAEEGVVHYPRFLYPLPKKFFYTITGDFYRYFISKYIFHELNKPDVVHTHHVYPDGYGMISICKKWDIPLVVDIHGDYLFTNWLNHSTLSRKVTKTLNFSSKIICISKNIYSLAREYGFDEKKLEYIPMGIDVNKFKPRNKEKIREKFEVQKRKVILFAGQLIKRKGINYLLRAISQVDIFHRKDCEVVIVGDGPEKKRLLNISRDLGIDNVVRFTGKVSEDDLLKWYSLADLFVLPSLSEGKPTVINEAMASECAVIATNVSGIPEQVKERYNGFLVEPKNPIAIADKIGYLLENEYETIRMGKNGRKRIIEEGWTWEGYAEKVDRVYKELMDG